MKEIAPYYPYNLQMWVKEINEIAPLYSLENNVFKCIIEEEEEVYCSDDYTILPILRPLSELDKHIVVNGELIMPLEVLSDLIEDNDLGYNDHYISHQPTKYEIDWLKQPYFITEKLFEWHFDVFDLHSKNLCVYFDEINKEEVM